MKKTQTLLIFLVFMMMITACGGSTGTKNSVATASPETAKKAEAPTPSAEASKPIKIGVLLSMTGTFNVVSTSIKNGLELYMEENKYTLNGRKVELFYEDDEGNPQTGLRKYRQLVQNNKVDFLIGTVNSAVAYAIRDEAEKDKIVVFNPNAAADELSWDKKSDFIYRFSFSSSQLGIPPAIYGIKNFGKTVYTIGADYPSGHEVVDSFVYKFKESGGKVIETAFPKLGTNDFGTYLTQIAKAKPDFVFMMLPGSDGIRFLQQYKEFGLKEKMPLIGIGDISGEAIVALGKNAEGYYSASNYLPQLDNALSKKFVEQYKNKYQKTPDNYATFGYDTAKVVYDVVNKAGGVKTDDLIKVLKGGFTFDSPRGPITLDPKTNNPTQNFYITKNVIKGSEVVPEVQETIKDVAMPASKPK